LSALLFCGVLSSTMVAQPSSDPRFVQLTESTAADGFPWQAQVSKDGSRVVFLRGSPNAPGGARLYSVRPDGSDTLPISGNVNVTGWHIGGSRVVATGCEMPCAFSNLNGYSDLWVMSLNDSEDPQRLTTDGEEKNGYLNPQFLHSVHGMTADGTRIYYSTSWVDGQRFYLMNSDGSAKREITLPAGHAAPGLLAPDGSRLLLFRVSSANAIEYVWWDLNSGDTTLIKSFATLPGHPVVLSRNGTRVVLRSDTTISVLDTSTGSDFAIDTAAYGGLGGGSLSGDGQKVTYLKQECDTCPSDVFLASVGAGSPQNLTRLAIGFNAQTPAIGDDGTSLAFSATADLDAGKNTDASWEVFLAFLGPSLHVDVPSRHQGEAFAFLGYGYTPLSNVTVTIVGPSGTETVYTASDARGWLTWPLSTTCATAVGNLQVAARDERSQAQSPAVTISVITDDGCSTRPTLAVDASSRPQEQTFAFSGFGYTKNGAVTMAIAGPDGTTTATAAADDLGKLSWVWPTTCETTVGAYTVTATDQATQTVTSPVSIAVTASPTCTVVPTPYLTIVVAPSDVVPTGEDVTVTLRNAPDAGPAVDVGFTVTFPPGVRARPSDGCLVHEVETLSTQVVVCSAAVLPPGGEFNVIGKVFATVPLMLRGQDDGACLEYLEFRANRRRDPDLLSDVADGARPFRLGYRATVDGELRPELPELLAKSTSECATDSTCTRVRTPDDDCDGLPNDWELHGVDVDQDFTADLNLQLMGARKDHKDLFIYYDWIVDTAHYCDGQPCEKSHEPPLNTIDELRRAFAQAPADTHLGEAEWWPGQRRDIQLNPDGAPGINLILTRGRSVKWPGDGEPTFGMEYYSNPARNEFDWAVFERDFRRFAPESQPVGWDSGQASEAARLVYRFVLFGHGLLKGSSLAEGVRDGVNGIGQMNDVANVGRGGRNAIVVLCLDKSDPSCLGPMPPKAVAGGVLHELGHTLGLGHGGLWWNPNMSRIDYDEVNHKPNHLSVMNYSFAYHGLVQCKKVFPWDSLPRCRHSSLLDYSVFGRNPSSSRQPDLLAALDESQLEEDLGLGGVSDSEYGSTFYDVKKGKWPRISIGQCVDWDLDGEDAYDSGHRVTNPNINKNFTLEAYRGPFKEWFYLAFSAGNGLGGDFAARWSMPSTVSDDTPMAEVLDIGPLEEREEQVNILQESVNPHSRGTTPVAILSRDGFDAPRELDPATPAFGRTGFEPSLAFCNTEGEDVNADGRLDLVCHFHTAKAALQQGDTYAVLNARSKDRIIGIVGADVIRVVPR
jgi:Tol biopolymer transport system component